MPPLPDDRAGKYHNDMLGMASDTVLRLTTLPRLMLTMLESDGWQRLVRPIDQRVFENRTISDWILGEPWPGLHFPDWATVYAILEKNIEVGTQCIDRLHQAGAPARKRAEQLFQAKKATKQRLPKNGEIGRRHSFDNVKAVKGGNSADYLTRKLSRDHPETFAAFARGEFRSVRAAAKSAGIVRDKTAYEQLQRLWLKVTPDERAAFLHWVNVPQ